MATFNKETGQILLSEDDKQMFKEKNAEVANPNKRDSVADNLKRWVLTGKTNK